MDQGCCKISIYLMVSVRKLCLSFMISMLRLPDASVFLAQSVNQRLWMIGP